uniref:Vesicle transport protein n=1 Tax=Strongyloides stercoralis TaxID=6248 RepID=A0A0K0EFF5_STRER
ILCFNGIISLFTELPKACFSKLYSSRPFGLLLIITLGFFL